MFGVPEGTAHRASVSARSKLQKGGCEPSSSVKSPREMQFRANATRRITRNKNCAWAVAKTGPNLESYLITSLRLCSKAFALSIILSLKVSISDKRLTTCATRVFFSSLKRRGHSQGVDTTNLHHTAQLFTGEILSPSTETDYTVARAKSTKMDSCIYLRAPRTSCHTSFLLPPRVSAAYPYMDAPASNYEFCGTRRMTPRLLRHASSLMHPRALCMSPDPKP
jgi:hypothetical protein